MTTVEITKAINDDYKACGGFDGWNRHRVYGARTQSKKMAIGDKLNNSKDYTAQRDGYDEEPTELEGTSATMIPEDLASYDDPYDAKDVQKTIDYNRDMYNTSGNPMYIIAGWGGENGGDDYEILMYDAEILAIID